MKKHGCILFTAVFVLGLLMATTNAQATEVEVPKIKLSGLIEVGGGWQDIDYDNGDPDVEDKSDLCLTTVELTAEAEINEWVNVAAVLLYEDFTFEDHETDVEIDEAMVTIGNTEEYPLYGSAGKMYVPFGALLTHFPDDPLFDGPVTLVFGETLEKAVLVGMKYEGFSVSAYAFNGDMDEFEEDNNVESYGVDANFSMEDKAGFDILIGGSYISNITDADGWEETGEVVEDFIIEEAAALIPPVALTSDQIHLGIKDYIPGAAGYVHVGFGGFFVEGEYMTALDELDVALTITGGSLAGSHEVETDLQPSVWNIEAGYNLDWGKNLEIVLEYAGSDEAEILGLPESRYGICLNQELYTDVILSLGYLRDEYDEDEFDDQRDNRDLVFAQIAVEF